MVPVILTVRARGHITERLPWEVLGSICDHFEEEPEVDEEVSKEVADRCFVSSPVPRPEAEAELAFLEVPSISHPWPEIPAIKHKKNLLVLSMTHVCRSWRLHLVGLKRLWHEIAFSADLIPVGIPLAMFFLTRVADDDVPLHIYAGLPFGDVFNPAIGLLLSKLRENTHRWERFSYWGRLGPYRFYLDLPAPGLRHFSDNKDLCHLYFGQTTQQTTQLFSGHVPALQSLTTSTLGSWQAANLSKIRALDLWDCAPRLCMRTLLNVLRSTPQLEEISIASPNLPLDCPPDVVVNLSYLQVLKVHNPDFYRIVNHFVIPNAEVVDLYSSANHGLQVGPTFQAAHLFSGFALMANPPPMFGQQISLSSIDVVSTLSGLRFITTIGTVRGGILRVDLEWAGGSDVRAWPDYIQASMSALAGMPFLSSSSIRITVHPGLIDYDNTLFHLEAIENLVVEDERFTTVLHILGDQPPPLPKLRYLFFPKGKLEQKEVEEIAGFLQFRKDLMIVLGGENRHLIQCLSDVCTIEGEFLIGKSLS